MTVRAAAAHAATTGEDAPTISPTGLTRKRASITYATEASIAYLVKNFTSVKAPGFWPAMAWFTAPLTPQ